MRRPLCLVCFVFAAFLWLSLTLFPPVFFDYGPYDRQECTVSGRVAAKEYRRASDGSLRLQLTLDHIALEEALAPSAKPSAAAPLPAGRRDGASLGAQTAGAQTETLSRQKTPPPQTLERFPESSRVRILCTMTVPTSGGGRPSLSPDVSGGGATSAAFSPNAGSPAPFAAFSSVTEPQNAPSAALRALDDSLPVGVRVCLRGELRVFAPATNPGEFDSQRYYRILRTAFRLQSAQAVGVSGAPAPLGDALCRLRRFFSGVLENSLPERESGVMKAMLLGEKGALDPALKKLYQQSGIAHILAISGLHLSLLGMGLFRLLRRLRLPRPLCVLICAVLLILYGQMTGLGPSSARALVMFLLRLAAPLFGRTYDLLTAVSLAALLLLIDQPLYLFHSGFLFSFGAVLAIGLLLPVLPGRFSKVLAVPLANLPVYLSFYYVFPPYSLLLNLAVIPLMSAVMVCGLAVLALGAAVPVLGALAGLPVCGLLWLYERLCLLSASLPGHELVLGAPPAACLLLFFIFLAVLVFGAERFFPPFLRLLWLVPAVLLLCLRPDGGLTMTFLDVGQGDGIYIESEQARILVDGGSSTQSGLAAYQLLPFLQSRGTAYLDLAVLSHDDADHCSGLLELLAQDEVTIGVLALPAVSGDCAGENYRALEALCRERGIPLLYVKRGDVLRAGALTMTVLHPQADAAYEDVNSSSLTLLVQYGAFSALLTGDLEKEGETDLLRYLRSPQSPLPRLLPESAASDGGTRAQTDIPVRFPENDMSGGGTRAQGTSPAAAEDVFGTEKDAAVSSSAYPITVLKAAHHGSRYATSGELLALLPPRCAVISAGRRNRYGHPAPETIERLENAGARIYSTALGGAVTFRTDGKRVTAKCFLKP